VANTISHNAIQVIWMHNVEMNHRLQWRANKRAHARHCENKSQMAMKIMGTVRGELMLQDAL